jgi:hypothetical protein
MQINILNHAIAPDYYADYLPDSPWIHQPFEKYGRMDIAKVSQQQ